MHHDRYLDGTDHQPRAKKVIGEDALTPRSLYRTLLHAHPLQSRGASRMRLARFSTLIVPVVLAALVSIGGAPSTAAAQTVIVGHVTAQGTLLPVPNARGIEVGTNAAALT